MRGVPAHQLQEAGGVPAVQLPQVRHGGRGIRLRGAQGRVDHAGRGLVLRRHELRGPQLRQPQHLLQVRQLLRLRGRDHGVCWLRLRRHSRLEDGRLDLYPVSQTRQKKHLTITIVCMYLSLYYFFICFVIIILKILIIFFKKLLLYFQIRMRHAQLRKQVGML